MENVARCFATYSTRANIDAATQLPTDFHAIAARQHQVQHDKMVGTGRRFGLTFDPS